MKIEEFFGLQDNKPPRNVKKMIVRSKMSYSHGPYQLELVSSCGSRDLMLDGKLQPHINIKGAMRMSLYDIRKGGKPIMIKRLQVDNWRECQAEFDEAKRLLR